MHRLLLLVVLLALPAAAQKYELVCVVGDSQTRGVAGAQPMYWQVANDLKAGQRFAAQGFGFSGYRCDQLRDTMFAKHVVTSGVAHGCTRVVIQCGHNDLSQGYTSAQICGTSGSPGPIRQMVSSATAAGIPVTIINVAPWGLSSSWNASRQTETAAVNACIASLASSTVRVVDAYTALGDGGNPQNLATAYGNGISAGYDGMHWDQDGHAVLGPLVFP